MRGAAGAAATDRPNAATRRAPIARQARGPSERTDPGCLPAAVPFAGAGAGQSPRPRSITLSGGIGLAKEELLELDGIVDEVLPDSKYRVTLENGVVVGAYASGRMRKNHIRILAGDRVTLELSVYDLTKGRINFRHKDANSPRPPRSGQPRR
ncbi:Translation initiation factor IF-1 [Burkholderia cenocepacia PC184]|nr:Translation initiation factor IF-1 [Burkholderia cenocepacia PC184]